MQRGDRAIEFYSNLDWLKEQYEAGFVVAKKLHEKAVNERGFKMKYWQFNKYFNEELNHRKYKRGEAKVEFYSNLDWIKDQYNNGVIISKFLFQKAQKEKNFKMGYPQFNKYFNEIFKPKKEVKKTPKNQKSNEYLVIFSSLPSK